jgi:crotonobetainyl-CoA:carnitine CoA-transferase CaiB-like acyl-CoA transferase
MDYRAGTAFTIGILAALWDRDRTGRGQHVDFSSREVFAAGAPDALLAHLTGVPWQPRLGNRHRVMAPHDVYPSADGGWLAIAVSGDQEGEALRNVVGSVDEGAAGDQAIRAWSASRRAPDAAATLRAAGVPASPVMSFADLATDPHLVARQVFLEVDHPVLGKQRVMRAPWLFSHWDGAVHRPGPPLGAHNDEVLGAIRRIPVD